MALKNEAVIAAAKGYIFTAPVGTAAPTVAEVEAFNPVTGFTSWESVGHTSREDLPEFGFDGGDTEARGTWQDETLRTVVTETAVDYVTFYLNQFDESAFSLYYGATNQSELKGEFSVASTTGNTQKALLIVVVDGSTSIAFYAPKCDMKRDDSIELAVDEFGSLPIRATFLTYTDVETSKKELFRWISNDTGINPEGNESA